MVVVIAYEPVCGGAGLEGARSLAGLFSTVT